METSFPKNKINILLLENIHPLAREMFQKEGFHVESLAGSISHAELEEKIKNVSVLGIRSKTNIDAGILDNAKRLLCVGAFCIGTNQIDLTACSLKGVAVFNAPFSNT
ncbi:MAG: phosphoglycerate dehydrogenase, partial [Candidatus Neomarinimicrobiota bacterium]